MNPELEISIHKLESGFHQVSFFNPVERRRVRKRFRVAGEAKKYEEFIREQFAANGLNASSAIKVSVLLKMYLESNQKTSMRRLSLPLFLSFAETFGDIPVMNVTKDDLNAWMDRVKLERGFADRTMEGVKSNISPFFEFLVDTNVIKINPFALVKIKCVRNSLKHVKFNEEEVKEVLKLVKIASPTLIYPVLYFLAQTGARLGEAQRLKWNQINFENGTIHLLQTKNGQDRLIQMSPQMIGFLKNHSQPSEFVFLNIQSEPWRVPQYRKQFQNVRREINFAKHVTNHGFRHSFAFNYLRQGGDMRQLQYILGHRKLEMTVGLYGKITPADIKAGSPFDF
jgi:integrase/recombinase XerD